MTSPPYFGLRDYGVGEIDWPVVTYSMPGGHVVVDEMRCSLGREKQPVDFIGHLVLVFREVRRVLTKDGTLWLNIGDTYAAKRTYQAPSTKGGSKHSPAQGFDGSAMDVPDGMKPKDLMLVPSMLAIALRSDGWWLRQDVIWHKPNAMPESVRDRPTTDYEHVFMLTRSRSYYYDSDAVREPAVGQNQNDLSGQGYRAPGQTGQAGNRSSTVSLDGMRQKRSVWSINTVPFKDAHFAVFPPALVEPCVLASSEVGDVVLDPFAGSGTTGMVARRLGREFSGSEPSPEFWLMAFGRIMSARSTTMDGS